MEILFHLQPSQTYSSSKEQTYVNGVTQLRNGKGAIYIKSSGNDYRTQSVSGECGNGVALSCTENTIDEMNQSPYIIVVGALDADGVKTRYSTPGASIWVSGFGGESGLNQSYIGGDLADYSEAPAIMTVDRSTCSKGYVKSGVDILSGRNYNTFNSGSYSENSSCNYVSTFNGTSLCTHSYRVVALMLEANLI